MFLGGIDSKLAFQRFQARKPPGETSRQRAVEPVAPRERSEEGGETRLICGGKESAPDVPIARKKCRPEARPSDSSRPWVSSASGMNRSAATAWARGFEV
jgi:hypothetical protein